MRDIKSNLHNECRTHLVCVKLTLAAVQALPSRRTGAAVRVPETEDQRSAETVYTTLLTAGAKAALATH